ncbi:MAG: type III polyketide synthase [Alphaproteobacteria bacterium]|nr:type III polyketide synthase [Alphaproteobacteria bacterium]
MLDTVGTANPPRIGALARATPPYVFKQADIKAAVSERLIDLIPNIGRLLPVYDNVGVDTRYSCVPMDWYYEPHDFGERNDIYAENALKLLEQVTTELLAKADLEPSAVDTLITISSTGITTPSLDARLIQNLGMRDDVQRIPVFGLGCAGGVTGLGQAAHMASSKPGSVVLLLVVELCALTFQLTDLSKTNIVALALFGDGAAGALLGSELDGPAVLGWGEHLWPNTLDIMGWDIGKDGFKVLLRRDLPDFVRKELPAPLNAYLDRYGLSLSDFDGFVTHPGGPKILDALEDLLDLSRGDLHHARSVLRDYGNMSSPTVLFILMEMLAANEGRRHLLSAMGPGFTASFAHIEA